jgi:hypothetical protein
MRALVALEYFNTAVGPTSVFEQAKIGGVYYRISGAASIVANTASNNSFQALILEQGQTFSVNTSQAGLNIFGLAWVFPNSSSLKTALLTSLSAGDNTLYTCPASKHCMVVLGNSQIFQSGNAAAIFVTNSSGGALNYTVNLVSSGGTPTTANKATPTTSVASGTGAAALLAAVFNFVMNPGDYINLNTSGPGAQVAWVTIYEL